MIGQAMRGHGHVLLLNSVQTNPKLAFKFFSFLKYKSFINSTDVINCS